MGDGTREALGLLGTGHNASRAMLRSELDGVGDEKA